MNPEVDGRQLGGAIAIPVCFDEQKRKRLGGEHRCVVFPLDGVILLAKTRHAMVDGYQTEGASTLISRKVY